MSGDERQRKIARVGVVGAGTMGAAIAQHFIMKGLPTVLVDSQTASLERGVAGIRQSLVEAVQRRVLTPEAKDAAEARLTATTSLDALGSADLVVEAVFENLDVKANLFRALEAVVPATCILATNTSSFSVSRLASGLRDPKRLVGVHYFYHAAKNKLVEIIPGDATALAVVQTLREFYALIDKSPIVVRDAPGFAVNRFFVPWLNEAARLFEEGVASTEVIDRVAAATFGIGMGPFALMNATGVPIALHSAANLAEAYGAFYAPAAALKRQVEKGEPWVIAAGGGKDDEGTVRERLLAAALGVAAQVVSEDVTDATSVDLGARVGLRWAKGPFEMINALGAREAQRIVARLFEKWSMPVPPLLLEAARAGAVRIEQVRAWSDGPWGYLELNRPDSMNALNEAVVTQLAEGLSRLERDPAVKTIILKGQGKAFVAGADIKFFLDNIAANDLDRIYKFTEAGQRLLSRLGTSPKRTIAYIDGLALGGGLELALSCRYRVATERAVLGFPETGIGIYPGLGGTQRTPRVTSKGIAKFLIATGQMLDVKAATEFGLIDAVVAREGGLEALKALDLDALGGPAAGKHGQPEEAFATFDGRLDPAAFANPVFKKYEKQLTRKAPLALAKAMELVDRGEALALDEALLLEMQALKWIFATQDAKTGLESVLTRAKPIYVGA
jgi:enoyl-CoA hydratase/3-hydroxyacyl-CoA dehydrogenase